MEETQKKQLLKYRVVESSSEESDNTVYELLKGNESKGWTSIRFCTYPQEILIQFLSPVNLSQINILSHEKKISSLVEFFTFYPDNIKQFKNENENKMYKSLSFNKLGYIRMDNNQRSSYKAREFRRVYVESDCLYLKIILHKNYVNKFNVFNQVSLMYLEFYGNPIINKPENIMKENHEENSNKEGEDGNINRIDLDEISKDKIKVLKILMDEAVKNEDFDEAKKLKNNIANIFQYGKKLRELENQKKYFIEQQDFDSAKIFKMEIDKMKNNIRNVDKQIKELNHFSSINNNSLDLNKSLGIINSANFEDNKESINNKEKLFNQNNNKSFAIEREKENSFSINNDGVNINIDKSFINKSLEKIIEKDEDLFYEDRIIPALKNKMLRNQDNMGQENKDNVNKSNSNNFPSLNLLTENQEEIIRGELENLDPKTKSNYDPLIVYIGEDNIRKIFSLQVVFKEEGLDYLLKSLEDIINKTIQDSKENETSKIINILMKLIFILMKDKHPHIVVKTIDIFQKLLSIINETATTKKLVNLSYDFGVTDKILSKIKEKLGDPNVKIRTKSVDLYCLLLRQNLCDYNNLLSELLDDEMEHVDTKKIAKSSKTIMGKLSIFDNVFDEIQNALNDKRTDANIFPFNLILKYIIGNISNSKSEIRKLARRILVKMYTVFGYKKIDPMLKKVDERELIKLVELVPEVAETIKVIQINNGSLPIKIQNQNTSQILSNKSLLARKSLDKKKSVELKVKLNKSIEKKKIKTQSSVKSNENLEKSLIQLNDNIKKKQDFDGEPEFDPSNKLKMEIYNNNYLKTINNLNNSNISNKNKIAISPDLKSKGKNPLNKNKQMICSYCGKSDDNFINTKSLEIHKSTDCPLFSNCLKCNYIIEVRSMNNHLLSECSKKSENKLCKRCKEPIDLKIFEEHLKNNNCNPAKNINSSNRCPLCHKDIPPYDKGFVQHLVNDKCPKQMRKSE